MPEYYFEVDRRVYVWQRDKYTIEANSEDEAVAKIKTEIEEKNYDSDKGYHTTETLDETVTEMSLQDNGDYSTIELRDDHGNVIWQNGTPNA